MWNLKLPAENITGICYFWKPWQADFFLIGPYKIKNFYSPLISQNLVTWLHKFADVRKLSFNSEMQCAR